MSFLFLCWQPAFFSLKAYVSLIKPDQAMWYRACKTCNKKVTEAIGSGYWCEGCQKNDEECSLRSQSIWRPSPTPLPPKKKREEAYDVMNWWFISLFICWSQLIFICPFRYIMVAKISDASSEAWVSAFNEQAERIIGCSAEELDKLKSQVDYLITSE